MRRRFGGIALTAALVGGAARAEPPGARQARVPPRSALSAPPTLAAPTSATRARPPIQSDRRERPRRLIERAPSATGACASAGKAERPHTPEPRAQLSLPAP